MALNADQRGNLIQHLIANCDCWKQEGDQELLENMADEKLLQLKESADREQRIIAVANSAVTGFNDNNGTAYRINPDTAKWEQRKLPVKNAGMFGHEPKDEEEEEEEDDDEKFRKAQNKKRLSLTGNKKKIKTTEDWMAIAPPDVVQAFNSAKQIETEQKRKHADELTVNIIDPSQRQAHIDRLMQRSVEELASDVALLASRTTPAAEPIRTPQRKRDDDILIQPTINWSEVAGQGKGQPSKQQSSSKPPIQMPAPDDAPFPRMTDEEWLKAQPPDIQQKFHSAEAVTNREKRRMIDLIVANITDEETEQRLRRRLATKTIEELEDLLELPGVQAGKGQVINYFGAAGGPAPQRKTAGTSDDLLVAPKIDWSELAANGKK